MAINKKLIHFKTKKQFLNELAKENIKDTSIVFIKDTQEIWTHGQLYSHLPVYENAPKVLFPELVDGVLNNVYIEDAPIGIYTTPAFAPSQTPYPYANVTANKHKGAGVIIIFETAPSSGYRNYLYFGEEGRLATAYSKKGEKGSITTESWEFYVTKDGLEEAVKPYLLDLNVFEESKGSISDSTIAEIKDAIDSDRPIEIKYYSDDEDGNLNISYTSVSYEYTFHEQSEQHYIKIIFSNEFTYLILLIDTESKTYEVNSVPHITQDDLDRKQESFELGDGLRWEDIREQDDDGTFYISGRKLDLNIDVATPEKDGLLPKGAVNKLGIPVVQRIDTPDHQEDKVVLSYEHTAGGYQTSVTNVPLTLNSATETTAGVLTAEDKVKINNQLKDTFVKTFSGNSSQTVSISPDYNKYIYNLNYSTATAITNFVIQGLLTWTKDQKVEIYVTNIGSYNSSININTSTTPSPPAENIIVSGLNRNRLSIKPGITVKIDIVYDGTNWLVTNCNAATNLATSVELWGNTFDGTNTVAGSIIPSSSDSTLGDSSDPNKRFVKGYFKDMLMVGNKEYPSSFKADVPGARLLYSYDTDDSSTYGSGLILSGDVNKSSAAYIKFRNTSLDPKIWDDANAVICLTRDGQIEIQPQDSIRLFKKTSVNSKDLIKDYTALEVAGNTYCSGRVEADYFTAATTTICTNLNADLVDGWNAVGNEGKVLKKSGYVYGNNKGSKIWAKIATIPYTNKSTDMREAILELHSLFEDKFATISIGVRHWELNSNINKQAYAKILSGNVPGNEFRVYYDFDSEEQKIELWAYLEKSYSAYNIFCTTQTTYCSVERDFVELEAKSLSGVETPTFSNYIEASYLNTQQWTGSISQYNALGTKDSNTLYFITDSASTTLENKMELAIEIPNYVGGKMAEPSGYELSFDGVGDAPYVEPEKYVDNTENEV